MSPSVTALVEALGRLSVLVVGEAMLDTYLEGVTDRLCREAPVPIVSVHRRVDAPGGAANAAANARGLGARVTLLSVVGDDAEAGALRRALDDRDVDTGHVVEQPERRTLAKQRVLAGSQMLVRFDQGSTERVDTVRERGLVERLEALLPQHDAVIVSDYGYGIVTPRVIAALRARQAHDPRVLVVDSKTLLAFRGAGVTAIKPNYREAFELLGLEAAASRTERIDVIQCQGRRLLDLTTAQIAAVTLDTEGALLFEADRPPYRTYARPTDHSRAAGAGDTFAAALALGLAAGGDVAAAAELASAAAAVVVGKDGTAACSATELAGALTAGEKFAPDVGALLPHLERYRRAGRRVVFTNGCFDILHRGHITYLNGAKALGDVLVVGLNTDDGVRRLKGPARPINPLDDRAQVLAALSCVDHIVAFADDTPVQVVRAIRPAVYVKGGDYTPGMLPEAPVVEALGGEVRILPYVEDRSTTGIIERIRIAAAEDRALRRIA